MECGCREVAIYALKATLAANCKMVTKHAKQKKETEEGEEKQRQKNDNNNNKSNTN